MSIRRYVKIIRRSILESQRYKQQKTTSVQVENRISTEDIKFQYCTEFILETDKISDLKMRDIMIKYGDSFVVVGDDGIIKSSRSHTNTPGTVLQEALAAWSVVTIK